MSQREWGREGESIPPKRVGELNLIPNIFKAIIHLKKSN